MVTLLQNLTINPYPYPCLFSFDFGYLANVAYVELVAVRHVRDRQKEGASLFVRNFDHVTLDLEQDLANLSSVDLRKLYLSFTGLRFRPVNDEDFELGLSLYT